MDQIRGQLIITIFPKQGYTGEGYSVSIYQMLDDNGKDAGEVTVVGNNLPATKGVTYKLDGAWVDNRRYGHQFSATGYVVSIGTNQKEITGYIQSLPGIGKKTAERIYDAFGQDTFKVLDEGWERIAQIRGISPKKAQAIKQAWDESKDTAAVYRELMQYGVTTAIVSKMMTEWPGMIWDMIEHYPYSLTRIHGFTFEMADALAYDKGFEIDTQERITTAATSVLMENEIDGHLGMQPSQFLLKLEEKLNAGKYGRIDRRALVAQANRAALDRRTILCTGTQGESEQYVYRTFTRNTEAEVADEIATHIMETPLPSNIKQMIDEEFRNAGLEPDNVQKAAVLTAFSNNLTVITGGPGTGKTTIIKVIKSIQRRIAPYSEICFLAPTGRAARRLSESTGERASTIHSRLKMFGTDDDSTELEANETIDAEMVIVDESSMIDIWVAHKLLGYTNSTARMVFVGDPAQLQSVGAGAFFRDVINSNCVPVARLSRIFRQSQGSAIITNAQKIEDGDTNLFRGHDFEINDYMQGDTMYDAMTSAYIRDADRYGIYQTVCLVPTKKEVADMNARIQAAVNPPSDTKPEFERIGQIFRLGDLVMELTNTETVVNGDIGEIVGVDPQEKSIIVRYYNTLDITYTKEDITSSKPRVTLAYAMTVHKAQGSEYQSVITCLQDINRKMKIRSIPYTAITRAKTICRFYGSYRALQEAVLIDDKPRRQTLLAHDIKVKTGMSPLH